MTRKRINKRLTKVPGGPYARMSDRPSRAIHCARPIFNVFSFGELSPLACSARQARRFGYGFLRPQGLHFLAFVGSGLLFALMLVRHATSIPKCLHVMYPDRFRG
jgi:hypothetical protein